MNWIYYNPENGRKYRYADTGQPYVQGEYADGGYIIQLLHGDVWVYLDNSPDKQTLDLMLAGLARLKPLGS